MVMLKFEHGWSAERSEHNRKIADYLNRHPMFRDSGDDKTCKKDFFHYINTDNRLQNAADDPDRLNRMVRAIWITGNYAGITEDDCDWFFDKVEELWCEYYDVQSSGFFDPSDPLPAVPRGLLKIPDKI